MSNYHIVLIVIAISATLELFIAYRAGVIAP